MFLEATIPIATNEQLQQTLYAIRNISSRSIVRYENNQLEVFVHLQETPLENIPVLFSHLGVTRMIYVGASEKELETLNNIKKDSNFANLTFENLTVPVPSFSEEEIANAQNSEHVSKEKPKISNQPKTKSTRKKRKNKEKVEKIILPDVADETETNTTVPEKIEEDKSNIDFEDNETLPILPDADSVQEEETEHQLIEIIDQSLSFLECGQKLSKICNIPERAVEAFIAVLNVSTKLYSAKTEYSWPVITSELKKRNIDLTYYNRSLMVKSTQASINKTFFEFLDVVTPKLLEKFQSDLSCASSGTQEVLDTIPVESTPIEESNISEVKESSDSNSTPAVPPENETDSDEQYDQLLKCMPKIASLTHLAEIKKAEREILTMDKSLPLQERISKVIELMGDTTWKNNTEHLSVSETLFYCKNFDAKFDMKVKTSKHYLIWAKRIRNFSYLYNPEDIKKRIFASDFITEIRQYIMSEEELANLK